MSRVSPIDPRPGFIGTVDARSARRQLHVSAVVAVVMAAAIGVSALALRPLPGFDGASQRAHIADVVATARQGLDAGLQLGARAGG